MLLANRRSSTKGLLDTVCVGQLSTRLTGPLPPPSSVLCHLVRSWDALSHPPHHDGLKKSSNLQISFLNMKWLETTITIIGYLNFLASFSMKFFEFYMKLLLLI